MYYSDGSYHKKEKASQSAERNPLSLKSLYSPLKKPHVSQKWGDCKEAKIHLLCHHVAAVNSSMPMTDVKLHENLEIRYGTKKRDARKRLVRASMLMQPPQATEWTHVLSHYMETNGKMANRSVALPELGFSASGQMLQATSQRSVVVVPIIPCIL